ncbi:glycosyltransferase family 2 protein [uncultured Streptococcus sp.]|uniref:glycosyltransferase family 2 protein n=1 Tax=uncultured Streptococcus sp. TaxID=83427 RepID=UPI0028E319E7|nr:glycosyltransferase family 2 protein [uncultured Streptococcus sp.]
MRETQVSIIIPVYNVENYLRSCLDSVLSQTYKDFEVLMVNDGSTDGSGAICQDFVERDSRFHYFEKENGGLSDARNYGLDRAKGHYITFLDSDDFLFEDYLENLYYASRLSDSDITIGGYCRFGDSNFYFYNDHFKSDSLVAFKDFQAIQYLDSMLDVTFLTFSTAWGKLFKRELFSELRFPYGKYAEDQFLIWKLYMKADKIYVFNGASYVYRMNPSGLSNIFTLKHLDYIDAIEERIKETKDIEGIEIQHSFNMYRYVLQRILGQLEEHDYIDEAKEVRKKLELAEQGQYSFLSDEVKEIEVENGGELISIIVPIYNVENYLRMCLDSIEHQTYSNIEVLLINDGSPDSSGEICQEYVARDSRFRYFEKENGGASDARNYGIERSNGKYLTFVDSDDWLSLTYVEDLYQAAIRNDSDTVISHYTIYNESDRNYYVHIWDDYYEKNYTSEELIMELPKLELNGYIYITSWGILFKKELFNNVKFPKGKVIEDSWTNYKLFFKSKKITYIHKEIYSHREGILSVGSSVNEKLLIDVLECLLERLAIYTIKGWNYSDEKNNVLGCLRLRYQQAKENGLQDTEIFRRYTEILSLVDES